MSGLFGYTGAAGAFDHILHGLSKLEYRGYDCAGISLLLNGKITTQKVAGRLSALGEPTALCPELKQSTCGIGSTRWAPGAAAQQSDIPPYGTARLSLVLSGMIENYRELRAQLSGEGYAFDSTSDGEVAAKLLDWLYKGNPVEALAKANSMLQGSYAIAVLFADYPHELYGVARNSTLFVGRGEGESYVTSDLSALVEFTREYDTLGEGEVVCLSPDNIRVMNQQGNLLTRETQTASQDLAQVRKGGYRHFMMKEICEQEQLLADMLRSRIFEGLPSFDRDGLPEGLFTRYHRVLILGCGTAMHAGALGKEFIEQLAHIPAEVHLAAEYRFRDPILSDNTLVIALSQSGETSDTLSAMRLAQSKGAKVLAIVNVPGSTMAREADYVLYAHAGPEISIASTKVFMLQMGVLYLVAIEMGRTHGIIDDSKARDLVKALLEATKSIGQVLEQNEQIQKQAREMARTQSVYYIGRGLDWPMMMEGSLKLKEVTYIHAEAYSAGEFRHGPISLVAPDFPVVALATQQMLIPQMLDNIREIRGQDSNVLVICRNSLSLDESLEQSAVRLPDLDDLFMPIPAAVALQLLAYYTAVAKGRDVDAPRHLTKAVTD
ncbi:MAG TPA: glutamine--fructose-6-phosphate transaminase (isomerizing) [Clostridiales bacterium]|nr:glutamine--fructose-6-phosphate transaminase (isomerizing) [Clostridiales bacterium]